MLQGIGYGFSIGEILDGKPKSAGSEVWEGVRGGSARAAFSRRDGSGTLETVTVTAVAGPFPEKARNVAYSISFSPSAGVVKAESASYLLSDGSKRIFEAEQASPSGLAARFYEGVWKPASELRLSDTKPALHQLLESSRLAIEGPDRVFLEACAWSLGNVQRIEPSLAVLRDYSEAQTVRRMGERGENFAALVRSILADPAKGAAYVAWLQQLTPAEVDDVEILEGALKEPLFALRDGVNIFPAPVLSDGTLRFAAIAAAFFQTDPPDLLTIEEIENAIHPSRMRLLVELLKSQSWPHGPQVFATTHSPAVLSWLTEEDLATTFLCRRDEETGSSRITPLSEIPRLAELAREQPIGELFTEGWLEGAA